MLTEHNKALVRHHFERTDQHDLDGAAAVYAASFRLHGLAPQPVDADGWKHTMAAFLTAFPDFRFAVEDMIAENDQVAVRHTFRGTHQGSFRGIPPTSNRIVVSGIVIYRVAHGKIVEGWLNVNGLGIMQQLGVLPALAETGT